MDDERKKVLNCIVNYQLDKAEGTPIAHVLLQDQPESAKRLRELIQSLAEEKFLLCGDHRSDLLYITSTGLLMSDFANEVSQFAEALLKFFIHRMNEDGVNFKVYTWNELKNFGIVSNDLLFNFAITTINTLDLHGGGKHSLGTTQHPPRAELNVPADLVDFRSFSDVRDLYKRVEQRRTHSATTEQVQRLVLARLSALDRSQWVNNFRPPQEAATEAHTTDDKSWKDYLEAVLNSLDEDISETLASQIRLIHQSRSRMHAEANRQVLGDPNNKLIALRSWQKTQTQTADEIAGQLIHACLKFGVPDDQAIAEFVSKDHNSFISSSASSMKASFRGLDAAAVNRQMIGFTATTQLGVHRALDRVRVARFDMKDMPMSTKFSSPSSETTSSHVKIFVSHSGRDRQLATDLVHCLEGCLELPDGTVRCTSVAGYALAPGASASETLRQNIEQSALVIVLLTRNSLASVYVFMELGGAWVLNKPTCPIIAPSATFEDLPDLLKDTHAVKSNVASDMIDLMVKVSKAINVKMRNPAKCMSVVNCFVEGQAEHQ